MMSKKFVVIMLLCQILQACYNIDYDAIAQQEIKNLIDADSICCSYIRVTIKHQTKAGVIYEICPVIELFSLDMIPYKAFNYKGKTIYFQDPEYKNKLMSINQFLEIVQLEGDEIECSISHKWLLGIPRKGKAILIYYNMQEETPLLIYTYPELYPLIYDRQDLLSNLIVSDFSLYTAGDIRNDSSLTPANINALRIQLFYKTIDAIAPLMQKNHQIRIKAINGDNSLNFNLNTRIDTFYNHFYLMSDTNYTFFRHLPQKHLTEHLYRLVCDSIFLYDSISGCQIKQHLPWGHDKNFIFVLDNKDNDCLLERPGLRIQEMEDSATNWYNAVIDSIKSYKLMKKKIEKND